MPFEEEDLQQILEDLIEYSNKRLSDKLGDISSVENLVELRNDFEHRVISYFKTVQTTNMEESKAFCLHLLSNLASSALHGLKINDIQDIHPSMMSSLKNDY